MCPHILCWFFCSKIDEGCLAQEQFIQSAWKSSAGILVRVLQPLWHWRSIVQCCKLVLIVASVLYSPGSWTVLSAPKTDRWSRECCWKNSILFFTKKFKYLTLHVAHTLKLSSCRVQELLFTWKTFRWQLNVITFLRHIAPSLPDGTLFIFSELTHESIISLMSTSGLRANFSKC